MAQNLNPKLPIPRYRLSTCASREGFERRSVYIFRQKPCATIYLEKMATARVVAGKANLAQTAVKGSLSRNRIQTINPQPSGK